MSFKLFFLSTFKGLKNTPKVESRQDALKADFQSYSELLDSVDLKVYQELDHYINSEAFKNERSQTQALKFSGSQESRLISEYEKLASDQKLKDFYITKGSADLQKFQQLEKSEVIKEFVSLRDYVQSKAYQEEKDSFKGGDSEKFEDTAGYKKYVRFQELSKSVDVLFWLEFPSGKTFKNYKEMVNSPRRIRYEELKAEIESDEFKARKEFLEDPNRWLKTEACQKEKKYKELRSEARFQIYERYKKSADAFRFFQDYDLVLEDDFEQGALDENKWKTISPFAEKTLGKNFSKAGDLQAYTEGNNVLQGNSNLKLIVKREKTEALVWNFPAGFVPANLDYSAAVLSSKDAFSLKSGVLEAKIKYQPKKQLVDLFYLSDDQNSFRINMLEAGAVCRFGVNQNNEEMNESLGGLSAGQFYIFRVEWEHGKISWKINGHEIYSVQKSIPDVPLRINMSTIVVSPLQELPHQFEVDWVRLYKKK